MMGLFSWLIGDPTSQGEVVLVPGDWDHEIVGESYNQDNLARVAGRKTEDGLEIECKATLIPEPNNQYDKNAVRVEINGLKAGHLSKEDARIFRRSIGNRSAFCSALIVGGWDRGQGDTGYFGVKLDIDWPPKLKE